MQLLQQEAQNNPEKANVALQTLLGGGFPGIAYNAYKDVKSPEGSPSRLANILGGGLLGFGGGAIAGGGLGYLAKQLGADVDPMAGAAIGGIGGHLAGQGIGAHRYNNKVDEFLKAKQADEYVAGAPTYAQKYGTKPKPTPAKPMPARPVVPPKPKVPNYPGEADANDVAGYR